MQRGQSLVVWAIAEGRKAAAGIDEYLVGQTELKTPRVAGVLR
jgi:glutamate synthase (NADPH/NADH) small chain